MVNKNGEMARLVLQNQEMSDEEVARRLAELSALKLHPREREEIRAVVARAERMYVATVGGLREQVFHILNWYQQILNSQDPLLVAKATKRMRLFLDQAEGLMADSGMSDFTVDLPDGDEEDEN